MLRLTTDQHIRVLQSLCKLAREHHNRLSATWSGYTSLMNSFLLHQLSTAETLLSIVKSFGVSWFPVSVGYIAVRTMFEVDVTSHYITQDPTKRSTKYIDFTGILNKKEMDTCRKHRQSPKQSWKQAANVEWETRWKSREKEIEKKYSKIKSEFTRTNRKGKCKEYTNWSGMSIRKMAEAVDHIEAYEMLYARLSSFAHGDIRLADRFLQSGGSGWKWTQRSEDFHVFSVFQLAAIFLTCFLELYAEQFEVWTKKQVQACWTE